MTFSHRLQRYFQPVLRLRNGPHLPLRRVARLKRNAEVLQKMPGKTFRLHIGEMQSETHMRAAAERHPGEAVARALRLVGESQRIEGVRLRPDLRHMMGEQR